MLSTATWAVLLRSFWTAKPPDWQFFLEMSTCGRVHTSTVRHVALPYPPRAEVSDNPHVGPRTGGHDNCVGLSARLHILNVDRWRQNGGVKAV
jgi:hypothetical protein